MGTLKQEYVCASAWDGDKKLDAFVILHPELFIRKDAQANGEVSYVMIWDGSKEGWDISDKADELREEFIKIIKESDTAEGWHIIDGDHYDEPLVRCV